MPPKAKIVTKGFLMDRVSVLPGSGCWEWTGYVASHGYGVYNKDYAHRLSYLLWKGEIPSGMQIDHLCRNRKCIRPSHLEVVTQRENILRGNGTAARHARQTHCVNGHEFNEQNTWSDPKRPNRQCIVCAKLRMREIKRRKRDARKAPVS